MLYIVTYIHTYKHTQINAYVHANVYAYIHTYRYVCIKSLGDMQAQKYCQIKKSPIQSPLFICKVK